MLYVLSVLLIVFGICVLCACMLSSKISQERGE
jgi:hypothetical protein